ncbi:14-3-3 domain containing protein [Cryptosporidium felis]|nr:14-3-3 domain containing protein [Cryptosporidium felis]
MFETLKTLVYLSEFENFELSEEEKLLISINIKQNVSDSRNRISQITQEKFAQADVNSEFVEVCNKCISALRKDIMRFLKSVNEVLEHLPTSSNEAKIFKGKIKSDISRFNLEFGFINEAEARKIHGEFYQFICELPDKKNPLIQEFLQNFSKLLSERFGMEE